MKDILLWISLLVTTTAVEDPIIFKLNKDRFHLIADAEGITQLVDLWVKRSDFLEAARYDPDRRNKYFLFTRNHPTIPQLIINNNTESLRTSDFVSHRRTVVIIHGWQNTANSTLFKALVPAFLKAEDANVLAVDWSAGSGTDNYVAAVINTVTSGKSVARFLTWLNFVSGANLSDYHIAGHSLGGHQVGVVGRNLGGKVPYITCLDPAMPGWVLNCNKFKADDGIYTEVMHVNGFRLGYLEPLGVVDFYPNKGTVQPGCDSCDFSCSHSRAYMYFAESLTSGGFTGTRCATYSQAITGDCHESGSIKMGGISPKTGQAGIFYMETNAVPPYSRG